MRETKDTPPAAPTLTTDAGLGWGVRFSPQVLVFMATFLALYFVAHGAVIAFVHAFWDDSYRQVSFVMDEWRPNDGTPYIAGHLDGSSEPSPFHLPGAVVDGRRVALEAPSIVFERGAHVAVWYSPEAPMFSYAGEWSNGVPVAALPTRPGWGTFAVHALASLAVLLLGLWLTLWVAVRFARGWGSTAARRA